MFRFVKWYKEQTIPVKILCILAFALFLILIFFSIAFCVGSFLKALTESEEDIIYLGLFSKQGKPLTYLFYFLDLVIIFVSFSTTYKNRVKISDERGVHYMEDNTFGSSRWMDEKEVRNSFEVASINDTTTTIYGQLTKDGEEVVGWKQNSKK